MRRAAIFLVLTVAIAAALGSLFVVIVFAPEPWQSRPWTMSEHSAGWLLAVFGWPITLGMMLFDSIGGRNVPEALVNPCFICLFVISGAFWAATFLLVRSQIRRMRSPNKSVDRYVSAAADGG